MWLADVPMATLYRGQSASWTCSPVTSTSGALPAAGNALIVRSNAGEPPAKIPSRFHTCTERSMP